MKFSYSVIGILTFAVLTLPVQAKQLQNFDLDLSRYRETTELKVQGITTPKVVQYKSLQPLETPVILVEKKTAEEGEDFPIYRTSDIRASRVIRSYDKIRSVPSVDVENVSSVFEGNKSLMVDGNNSTFMTFDSNDETHEVELLFEESTDVTAIDILTDTGIINPRTVTVEGLFSNGEWRTIVSKKTFTRRISWPKVWVKKLRFRFDTPHLFRVNEINFLGQEASQTYDEVVFYAEEGGEYVLFHNPSFGYESYATYNRYQPLQVDDRTPSFSINGFESYQGFNSDYDGDGINDDIDLCPRSEDPDNTDLDNNGRGDVCEDPDQDNRVSSNDNCPFTYNPNQSDIDADGRGDECDDTEDRITENSDFLLYGVFGLIVVVLGALVWRNIRQEE